MTAHPVVAAPSTQADQVLVVGQPDISLADADLLVDSVRRFREEVAATHEQMRWQFFANPVTKAERLRLGVAETPPDVVKLMVTHAVEAWVRAGNRVTSDMRWLDPCVGTGAFPIELVRRAIASHGAQTVDQLPRIDGWDISATAVLSTLAGIDDVLKTTAIRLADYLRSGRLKIRQGDFLERFPDSPSIDKGSGPSDYDIVIGNPPYVRSRQLELPQRKMLSSLFPGAYHGAADLHGFFFLSGLNALRFGGVLTYVTPASYTRAANGALLRSRLLGSASVDTFIDLDEAPLFEGIDVHAAITILSKGQEQGPVRFAHRRGKGPVAEGIEWSDRELAVNPVGGLAFRPITPKATARTGPNTTTLAAATLSIRSGVRPGVTKAFIASGESLAHLDAEVRANWTRPILLGADIQRWRASADHHYLIWTPKDCTRPPDQILELLYPYRDALERRPERRNLAEWYMLRPCTYYAAMSLPTICYPDIATRPRFSISPDGTLVADGAYFINSADPMLLAILNSTQALGHFNETCASIGSLASKGRFRLKTQAIRSLPIPTSWRENTPLTSHIRELASRLVSGRVSADLEADLQAAVDELYQGTEEGWY